MRFQGAVVDGVHGIRFGHDTQAVVKGLALTKQ